MGKLCGVAETRDCARPWGHNGITSEADALSGPQGPQITARPLLAVAYALSMFPHMHQQPHPQQALRLPICRRRPGGGRSCRGARQRPLPRVTAESSRRAHQLAPAARLLMLLTPAGGEAPCEHASLGHSARALPKDRALPAELYPQPALQLLAPTGAQPRHRIDRCTISISIWLRIDPYMGRRIHRRQNVRVDPSVDPIQISSGPERKGCRAPLSLVFTERLASYG